MNDIADEIERLTLQHAALCSCMDDPAHETVVVSHQDAFDVPPEVWTVTPEALREHVTMLLAETGGSDVPVP